MVTMQVSVIAAIVKAEEYLTLLGYAYGPCLGAECTSLHSQAEWNVEFAYEGLCARSTTINPVSIVLVVNLEDETVRLVDGL